MTAPRTLVGAHMPTAGGIWNALTSGRDIGCDTVQLFTSSPQRWQHTPVADETVERFHETQVACGIRTVISHDSYLINLATPDVDLLERSVAAFQNELERCAALGIPWVVTHMGAHMETGVDAGLELLAASVSRLLEMSAALSVGIALETTAGQGTTLGFEFEHIARVLASVGPSPRLGACLDTCHIFAAGYDVRTDEGMRATLDLFDAAVGLDRLRVIHANDAKKPLASRVDRHAHLGEGEIGEAPFRVLMTEPRLSHVPIILETPEAEKMHVENLRRLRRLERGEPAVPSAAQG